MADAPDPEVTPKKAKPELPHCGVIMPISGTPDYPASHWADMLQLIKEASEDAKYACEIVSATGRDDIIHASIVTNIYQNEMVVCDVSSRNPNVMLELGLRLASKLPVIIIFDGQGSYPFDIGTIRYMPYPKDMRYYDTQKFKQDLTAKIVEVSDTHKKGAYKSFLSHFKNVNFDLDTVGSETQTLKEFMERIDDRLSSIERRKDMRPSNSDILSNPDNEPATIRLSKTTIALIHDYIHSKNIKHVDINTFKNLLAFLKIQLPSADLNTPRIHNAIVNEVIEALAKLS